MATLYSSHYNSDGATEPGIGLLADELVRDATRKVGPKFAHSRMRRSHARIGLGSTADIGDEARMLTLKSSDILYSLLWSTDGAGAAGEGDLGWYKSGAANNGALPSTNSVDAFSSTALVIDTANTRVEAFELGDYDTENIGLQVWQLINISDAATYSVDPGGTFDITFTMTEAVTTTLTIVQLEAFYVAGD